MPETYFQIQWSDGSQSVCYSPSSVVKNYFTPNTDYDLDDFVTRSRVAAKYGFPCSRAMGQLASISVNSAKYKDLLAPKV